MAYVWQKKKKIVGLERNIHTPNSCCVFQLSGTPLPWQADVKIKYNFSTAGLIINHKGSR